MAFTFGPQHSWQQFAVYFLCSDGGIFVLCPVAPFGAAVPASAAEALSDLAASADDVAYSATSEAWLQQVGLHSPRMLTAVLLDSYVAVTLSICFLALHSAVAALPFLGRPPVRIYACIVQRHSEDT